MSGKNHLMDACNNCGFPYCYECSDAKDYAEYCSKECELEKEKREELDEEHSLRLSVINLELKEE